MTRFIQQQIPPTPTRQVPQTPCPACPGSALGGFPAKTSVPSAAVSPQPQSEIKSEKTSKPTPKRQNKK